MLIQKIWIVDVKSWTQHILHLCPPGEFYPQFWKFQKCDNRSKDYYFYWLKILSLLTEFVPAKNGLLQKFLNSTTCLKKMYTKLIKRNLKIDKVDQSYVTIFRFYII